ncbi:MAG: glycosyltransferase family 4 protein [Pirellulaceae bacterium]|nr:glycosyltransferase family 4 protein [Pirellulaceae bacterium]
MRVAHIITRMIVGGAQENTLLNCLDLIHIHGDDVLLVTGPAIGPEGDLLRQGRGGEVPLAYLPKLRRSIHPWRDAASYRGIKKILKEFQPDVVHTHSAKGGFLGRLAAWSLQVPAIVHTVHGAPFHPFQNPLPRTLFRLCEWFAARRCHAIISVADAMTDLMVKAGVAPREKFTTIHSGMDVEPFLHADDSRDRARRELGYSPEHVVIGKIARLFHLKGHDDVIGAAKEVIQKNPQVRFLFIGNGLLRDKLQQQIDAAGLHGHFQFTGLVPPAKIPELLGAVDILVHASLREGLARALPQALIAGKPVVSYDVDGAREVCITGQTGCLIPPRDLPALAAALTQLAGDPLLRHQLGNTGRSRFTDRFRHETMTRRIRELYERVLGGRK